MSGLQEATTTARFPTFVARPPRERRAGHCYVCGRQLSSALSRDLGIGPTCRKNTGISSRLGTAKQGSLLDLPPLRCKIAISRARGVLGILDLGGEIAAAKDAQAIVVDLVAYGEDMRKPIIVYPGNDGDWFQILVQDGHFKSLGYLGARSFDEAVDMVLGIS